MKRLYQWLLSAETVDLKFRDDAVLQRVVDALNNMKRVRTVTWGVFWVGWPPWQATSNSSSEVKLRDVARHGPQARRISDRMPPARARVASILFANNSLPSSALEGQSSPIRMDWAFTWPTWRFARLNGHRNHDVLAARRVLKPWASSQLHNMFCIPVPGYVRGSSLIRSFFFRNQRFWIFITNLH
jgi:hypothetical protein